MTATAPGASGAPGRPGRGRALAAIVLACAALKLCVLLAPPDQLLPGRRGMSEELHRGMTAQELLDGPLLPFQDYQVNHFSGGSLVMGVLAAPSFLAFGPTVVAMRLPTLLFGALAACMLFLVLDRWVGRRAAWAGGLLLALAPPGYSMVAATAWGTHLEANALAMTLLYATLCFHERGRAPRSGFLLGVLAGFSIYFGYVIFVALGTLLAFELLADKLFFTRRWFWVRAGGVLVGLLPWVVYNVNHGFAGLRLYGRSPGAHVADDGAFAESLATLWSFLTVKVPDSFYLPELLGLSGRALDLAVYGALLALVAFAAWGQRVAILRAAREVFASPSTDRPRAPLPLFLAYPAFFSAAYVFSDFRIQSGDVQHYRYAMPIVPWLFLAAATGFEALAARGAGGRRLASGLLAALLALSVAGNLAQCNFRRAPETWATPGYSHSDFGRFIALTYLQDREPLTGIALRLGAGRPAEVQHEILFTLGKTYKVTLHPDTKLSARDRRRLPDYEAAIDLLHDTVPEAFRPYFERPVAGERFYAPEQRERFWKDWRARSSSSDE